MALRLAVSLIEVVFIIVVFVIVHCRNMYDITSHGATAAVALISSSAAIQEVSPED